MRRNVHCVECLGLSLALLAPACVAAQPYLSITPVAVKYTNALSLNDVGQYALNNFPPEIPYETAAISGPTASAGICSLGGYSTRISSLNNKGQAVGISTTPDGMAHSFFYASGRMHDLTGMYGPVRVNVLNDRGDMTAQSTGQDGTERAAVIRDGRVDVFGPPNSMAGDIYAAGDVLVEYFPPGQGSRTAVYSGGRRQAGRPPAPTGSSSSATIPTWPSCCRPR